MIGKIWKRHFIKQTLKVFFLILFCFSALYVLIDLASRSTSQSYVHSQLDWGQLCRYYAFELIQQMDVIIPFALLIATIRTLTLMNVQNELVALLASGVKMKALLRPFLLLGIFGVGIVYLNTQYTIPYALKEMRHVQDAHAVQKKKKNRKLSVQNLALKDGSVILFLDYDPASDEFFDAYWILSFNEIYHMKYLSPKEKVPIGRYVDHLVRDSQGKMVKAASFETRTFPHMRFNRKILFDTTTTAEELSLSKLWEKLPAHNGEVSEKQAQISAAFYQKLLMPWLCFLAVIAPAPFCVRFSRTIPAFMIYSVSLFGLAACYLVINASVVLASRQVLPALWAILPPYCLFFFLPLWKYARIK